MLDIFSRSTTYVKQNTKFFEPDCRHIVDDSWSITLQDLIFGGSIEAGEWILILHSVLVLYSTQRFFQKVRYKYIVFNKNGINLKVKNMKNIKEFLILFVFVVSLFTTSTKANNFKSLDSNISIEDRGAVYYFLSRCSALYISIAGVLMESNPDLSKTYQETAETLTVLIYIINKEINNISSDESVTRSNNLLTEMVDLYRDDMQSNYVKTGSYVDMTYMQEDLLSCQSF